MASEQNLHSILTNQIIIVLLKECVVTSILLLTQKIQRICC